MANRFLFFLKKFVASLLLLLLIWIPLSFPAYGSFISLTQQTQVHYSDGRLEIKIGVTNHGDEPAYHVQASGEVEGIKFISEEKSALGVKETWNPVLAADLNLKKPGIYPVLLTIRYTDANRYPFSAISVPVVSYQTSLSPKVPVVLQGMELSTKGSTRVEVKNLDFEPRNVHLTYFAPEELSVSKEGDIMTLEPRGEVSVPLTVKNISALTGSSYPFFAISEYETEDHHFSAVSNATVKVVKSDPIRKNKTALMTVGGLLVVFFVIINLWSMRRRFVRNGRRP